jgi:hypothetical protein
MLSGTPQDLGNHAIVSMLFVSSFNAALQQNET